jgi:hypothetical protein
LIVGRFLALEKMVGDYLYKCGQEVVGEEVFSQFYRYRYSTREIHVNESNLRSRVQKYLKGLCHEIFQLYFSIKLLPGPPDKT